MEETLPFLVKEVYNRESNHSALGCWLTDEFEALLTRKVNRRNASGLYELFLSNYRGVLQPWGLVIRTSRVIGRFLGIALVCVMVGVTFGGLLSAVESPQVQASFGWGTDNGFTAVDTQFSQQYNTLPSPTVKPWCSQPGSC